MKFEVHGHLTAGQCFEQGLEQPDRLIDIELRRRLLFSNREPPSLGFVQTEAVHLLKRGAHCR